MTERRLRQTQHAGRSGQSALPLHFEHDGQVDPFQHDMNEIDGLLKKDHFTS
ncbi:MAG: hypothetical protein WCY32_07925 [Burkholderiaceae bacterium]